MTDYNKLVEALRSASTVSTAWEKLMHDAAAAIEDLEARLGEAENSVERWKDMYLTKHEPKRGEWTEIDDYNGDFHYQCSVCGEEWYFIDGTPADNNANYCPRCGAKMEVQDGK